MTNPSFSETAATIIYRAVETGQSGWPANKELEVVAALTTAHRKGPPIVQPHEPPYVTCSSCGSKGYYPISRDWWWEHTSFWHSVKWWVKRRLWPKLQENSSEKR